jgi:hypothetical protein
MKEFPQSFDSCIANESRSLLQLRSGGADAKFLNRREESRG